MTACRWADARDNSKHAFRVRRAEMAVRCSDVDQCLRIGSITEGIRGSCARLLRSNLLNPLRHAARGVIHMAVRVPRSDACLHAFLGSQIRCHACGSVIALIADHHCHALIAVPDIQLAMGAAASFLALTHGGVYSIRLARQPGGLPQNAGWLIGCDGTPSLGPLHERGWRRRRRLITRIRPADTLVSASAVGNHPWRASDLRPRG